MSRYELAISCLCNQECEREGGREVALDHVTSPVLPLLPLLLSAAEQYPGWRLDWPS